MITSASRGGFLYFFNKKSARVYMPGHDALFRERFHDARNRRIHIRLRHDQGRRETNYVVRCGASDDLSERFSEQCRIRLYAEMLCSEKLAGAAEAGLYFIEDQQDAIVVAELPSRGPVIHRRYVDAALALDRFPDDRDRERRDR